MTTANIEANSCAALMLQVLLQLVMLSLRSLRTARYLTPYVGAQLQSRIL